MQSWANYKLHARCCYYLKKVPDRKIAGSAIIPGGQSSRFLLGNLIMLCYFTITTGIIPKGLKKKKCRHSNP